MLKIPLKIYEEMIAHANEDFPLECCGILGGKDKDNEITNSYRIKNIDESKVTYLMDPREQIKVFKDMRTNEIELKAIYHSHPNHPAYPSQTDVRLAYYPEAVYIIISINDNKEIEMHGFRILEGNITEADLEITK